MQQAPSLFRDLAAQNESTLYDDGLADLYSVGNLGELMSAATDSNRTGFEVTRRNLNEDHVTIG
jgi:hypothetical protein